MEEWKEFLGKKVKVIYDDKPSEYPKIKIGILKGITTTHLMLEREKTEALRLIDIRRVEGVDNG